MAEIISYDGESYAPNTTVTILPEFEGIDPRGLSATAKASGTPVDPSLSAITLNITVTSTSSTEPTPAVPATEPVLPPPADPSLSATTLNITVTSTSSIESSPAVPAEPEISMLAKILEYITPTIKPLISLVVIISSIPPTYAILGGLHFLLIGSVIYSTQNAGDTQLARVLPSFACPYDDFVNTNGCGGPKACLYIKPGSCSEFVDCRWSQVKAWPFDTKKYGREETPMVAVAKAILMECPYSNDELRLEWNDLRKRCDYPGTEGTCSFGIREVIEEDMWEKRYPEHWTMVSPAVLVKRGYDRIRGFVTGFYEG